MVGALGNPSRFPRYGTSNPGDEEYNRVSNPARIVIGGRLSDADDLLFTPLRNEIKRPDNILVETRINIVPLLLSAKVLCGCTGSSHRAYLSCET